MERGAVSHLGDAASAALLTAVEALQIEGRALGFIERRARARANAMRLIIRAAEEMAAARKANRKTDRNILVNGAAALLFAITELDGEKE